MIVPSFFLVMDDLQRGLSRTFGCAPGRCDEEDGAPCNRELADGLTTHRTDIARVEARIEGRLAWIEADRRHSQLHAAG